MEQGQLPEPLTDDQGRPVRPCINCRTVVAYNAQPGDGTCPKCGQRQYLTLPSSRWPTGGVVAYWTPNGKVL